MSAWNMTTKNDSLRRQDDLLREMSRLMRERAAARDRCDFSQEEEFRRKVAACKKAYQEARCVP